MATGGMMFDADILAPVSPQCDRSSGEEKKEEEEEGADDSQSSQQAADSAPARLTYFEQN
jgi:hypothetical protein